MRKDKPHYTILAIDTSCDETSAAVVKGSQVLSNVLPSQTEFHAKYGGIVPNLARLAHQERIDNVVKEALSKSKKSIKDIDAIAVTIGPGLAIALEIGIKKAKELATENNLPLITINHMEGHLLSGLAQRKSGDSNSINEIVNDIKTPVIGFLISGKHTELVLFKKLGEYKKLGDSLDDSAGEAYDKCGRMLGLGYPAGPILSDFAEKHRKDFVFKTRRNNKTTLIYGKNKKTNAEYELPVSMANSGDLNFSYSGLKTAFKNLIDQAQNKEMSQMERNIGENSLSKDQIYDLAVMFEAAALKQLEIKLEQAIKEYKPKEVWVGGGVVASARLRSVLRSIAKKYNAEFIFPFTNKLTTDNAAMIGFAASLKLSSGQISLVHDPKNGVYFKQLDLIDRLPRLSL